jgi:isocitrate lyase
MIFEQLVPAPAGRFQGIERPYSPADVARLRGSLRISYTLAQNGANRLWELLQSQSYVPALGAMTGNQATQMVRAGLEAIYLSGWQVAADSNTAGTTYPDQSLYPCDSGPDLCRRINRALARADQIEHAEGGAQRNWFAPIVADAEAGFGGPLNVFEIMKAYIEAGAAGVHFEDQLASEKKCGHLGGKVLIPTMAHERNLIAARLAADVCGVPTIVMARTDAESARLITSNVDERDHEFITREQTPKASIASSRAPVSTIASSAGSRSLATPTCCGGRPRGPILTKRGGSRRRSTPSSPASSSPTIARPRSIGRAISMPARSPASSGSWAPWATSSSSSRSPASTASITACSSSPALIGRAAWRPIRGCSRRSSPRRRTAIQQPAISARSAPAISTSST